MTEARSPKEVGAYIRRLREQHGRMQQQELAAEIGVHKSVLSRWENGRGMPPLESLVAICEALGLRDTERDALIGMAGYMAYSTEQRAQWMGRTSEELHRIGAGVGELKNEVETGFQSTESDLGAIRRGVESLPDEIETRLRKVLATANPWTADVGAYQPPHGFVAPVRVAQNSLPLVVTESLTGALLLLARGSVELSALYVVFSVAALLWFSGPRLSLVFRVPSVGAASRRSVYIAELLFVCLLVVLNSPLLLAAYTRIDQYGFFLIEGLPTGGEFVLSALANVAIAVAATSLFYVLWYRFEARAAGPLEQAFGTVGPAILLAYVPAGLLSFRGLEVFFLIALFPLFLALITIVACSHPDLRLDEFIAKLVLQTAILLVILAFVLSAIALVLHITKAIEPVIPAEYSNALWSHPIDWTEQLGYEPEDFINRNIYGLTWMTAVDMFFLLAVPAPILMVTIYRRQYLPTSGTVASV